MSTNPQVPQGTINRLRGSIEFPSNAGLNITAPFLTKKGISASFDGEITQYLDTMTAAATSPEPYLYVTLTVNLVRSVALAQSYKAQIEYQSTIGAATFRSDTSAMRSFHLTQVSVLNADDFPVNGESAEWTIKLRGVWLINSNLWSLT